MTRINLINPGLLTDQHLLAEHREIKRIPNSIKNWRFNLNWMPENYTLGKGHVKFFYNKILFLKERYDLLYKECLNRWFNIENYSDSFNNINSDFMHSFKPDANNIKENIERIKEKIETNPDFYKLNKTKINKNNYLILLNNLY